MIKFLSASTAIAVTAAAAAIGVFAFAAVFAFAQTAPAVTVSGGEGTSPVTYSYSADSKTTSSKSIKELLTGLSNLESGSITQSITVSSESDVPVRFWLRISEKETEKSDALPQAAESTPAPDADSVLDYYSVKITTAGGEEIYDSSAYGKTSPYDTYKDMELLTLNGEETSDFEEYVIEISTNDALDALSADAAKLEWLIVSDGYSASLPVSDSEDGAEAVTLAAGSYAVGEDIDSGKYIITGDSTVKVYTAEDDLKTNIILTTDKAGKTGVEEYTLNISDGERIELTSDTVFTPYNASQPSSTATAEAVAAVSYAAETDVETDSVGTAGTALAMAALALGAAAAAASAVFIRKKNEK
ncbi:MAG: hypothetical protein LUD03_03305 [Firmicutes bacterium]|nr:hypothetical protein [Bacillota bacterium]